MTSTKSNKFGIALIQLNQTPNKSENVANAEKLIRAAVVKYNPKIVALPECFNSPYGSNHFEQNAEYIPSGPTSVTLSTLARELDIYVVGGSYPEIDANDEHKFYNTIAVFSNTGELVAKHRKIHLSDVHLGPDFVLRESEKLSPGNSLNTFEVDGFKFGLGICYDAFFSEVSLLYQALGCHMIFFPSAYPLEGGHFWDLKMRSRSSDTQLFVAGISAARNNAAEYVCHGYSCFSNPEGKIVKQAAGFEEEIVFYEIDFNDIQKYRCEIPMIKHRRSDIYETILKKDHLNN